MYNLHLSRHLVKPFRRQPMLRKTRNMARRPDKVLDRRTQRKRTNTRQLQRLLTLNNRPYQVRPTHDKKMTNHANLDRFIFIIKRTRVRTTTIGIRTVTRMAIKRNKTFSIPTETTRTGQHQPANILKVNILQDLPRNRVAQVVLIKKNVNQISQVMLINANNIRKQTRTINRNNNLVSFKNLLLIDRFTMVQPKYRVRMRITNKLTIHVHSRVTIAIIRGTLGRISRIQRITNNTEFRDKQRCTRHIMYLNRFTLMMVNTNPPALTYNHNLGRGLIISVNRVARGDSFMTRLRGPTTRSIRHRNNASVTGVQ